MSIIKSLVDELRLFLPEGLQEDENVHSIGNAIYIQLSTNNKLKIYFTDSGTYQHWDTIQLEIINPNAGKIDSLRIRLSRHIWNYRVLEWYGGSPTLAEYNKVQRQIQEYFSLYEPYSVDNMEI